MKRILIFQHMDHDTAGRFTDFFAEDGFHPDTVRLWQGQAIPDLSPYDLLLILGGVMDVWQTVEHPWLTAEKQAIKEWVLDRARPYIGLCLGHQLLAESLGGEVGFSARGEVGVFEIAVSPEGSRHPAFRGLGGSHRVMEWHFAEVKVPPPGANVLASSPDTAIQAMAVGDHALGLQFHAEFTPQSIASWASLPAYISALEKVHGSGAYEQLTRKAYPLMPAMSAFTRHIYRNLLTATGLKTAA